MLALVASKHVEDDVGGDVEGDVNDRCLYDVGVGI